MLCGCDVELEGGVWLMDDPTLRWTLMNWLGPEGFSLFFVCFSFCSAFLLSQPVFHCIVFRQGGNNNSTDCPSNGTIHFIFFFGLKEIK
jgi:hypothetical protein